MFRSIAHEIQAASTISILVVTNDGIAHYRTDRSLSDLGFLENASDITDRRSDQRKATLSSNCMAVTIHGFPCVAWTLKDMEEHNMKMDELVDLKWTVFKGPVILTYRAAENITESIPAALLDEFGLAASYNCYLPTR